MVNVDASYDENRGSGSTGVIIRDCSGDMIVAASRYIPHLVDAPMAEAFALKDGLMLSQQIGGNRIIIQSDCMEVVEIMSCGGLRQIRRRQSMMNVTLCGADSRKSLYNM